MSARDDAIQQLMESGYGRAEVVASLARLGDRDDLDPAPCATCQGNGWVPDHNLPHTRNEPCRDCNRPAGAQP